LCEARVWQAHQTFKHESSQKVSSRPLTARVYTAFRKNLSIYLNAHLLGKIGRPRGPKFR
jgi:hypothetical protein